jgi:Family of unknown function (DUF6263)
MRISSKFSCGLISALLTALVFLCEVSPSLAQEELRWKFHEGEKLDYNMIQDMTIGTLGGPLGAQNVTMHQEMAMTWEVVGVNSDGDAVIRQKFERIKMKMALPGLGGFEYDTDSDEAPAGPAAMLAPMYKKMTESEFELTMTSRGEIKEVKIPDDVLAALRNSPGAQALGEMATPEGFKKMIAQGALVLPEKAPKPDDEWSTKVEVNNPMAGKQVIETTYKYVGTKDVEDVKYAVFEPTLKMTFEGTEQVQMKVSEQESGGEILFDIAAGRLHSTKLEQNVTIDVTVGGQTIQQKIDQTIDVTVTPAEEAADSASTEPESSQ